MFEQKGATTLAVVMLKETLFCHVKRGSTLSCKKDCHFVIRKGVPLCHAKRGATLSFKKGCHFIMQKGITIVNRTNGVLLSVIKEALLCHTKGSMVYYTKTLLCHIKMIMIVQRKWALLCYHKIVKSVKSLMNNLNKHTNTCSLFR